MGRELGLVLFVAAAVALFVYDLFVLTSAVYYSRLVAGAALVVLAVFLIGWVWSRRR